MTGDTIKLSSPATREFWEIDVLFEDEHLLALDKPARLLTSPDRYDPQRPNLAKLLHRDIERGAPWAARRKMAYLMNAHRLDFETSGVLLFAKNKPALIALANLFGTEKPVKVYVALAQGPVPNDAFEVNVKLGPHPVKLGVMRADPKNGKQSTTRFKVREKFAGSALLDCMPLTGRTHQIRVHLQQAGLRIFGDTTYGGEPLLLSRLKCEYRLKPNRTEKPLLSRVALHAEQLSLDHPVTGQRVHIEAPWPKDFTVAIKYLRRYAPAQSLVPPG